MGSVSFAPEVVAVMHSAEDALIHEIAEIFAGEWWKRCRARVGTFRCPSATHTAQPPSDTCR